MESKTYNADILKSKFSDELSLKNFSDKEALELLLYYAFSQKKDTSELSQKLIDYFGSIPDTFNAEYQVLANLDGMTNHTAVLMKMIPDIARKYCGVKGKSGIKTFDFEKVGSYLAAKFLGMHYEMVIALVYDKNFNIVGESLLKGFIPGAILLDYKTLFGKFAGKDMSYVVLAHNHPKVSTEPSREDIIATKCVQNFLKELNAELIEHYVVSKGKFRGIINNKDKEFLMKLDI